MAFLMAASHDILQKSSEFCFIPGRYPIRVVQFDIAVWITLPAVMQTSFIPAWRTISLLTKFG